MFIAMLFLNSLLFAAAPQFTYIPDNYFTNHSDDMCDNTSVCPNDAENVSYLQIILNADDQLSININHDGNWGPQTKSAVESFQSHYGLTSDGWVGAGTRSKLDVVLARLKAASASNDDFYLSNTYINQSSGIETGTNLTAQVKQHYNGDSTTTLNSYVGFYLSTDNQLSNGDILLGDDRSTLSASDRDDNNSDTISIPNGTSAGTYYLLYVADYKKQFAETNEDNNVEFEEITVSGAQDTPADLSVRSQDISIHFPSSSGEPKIGDEFYVKARVYNNGEKDAGSYQLRFSYKNSSSSSFSSFDGEYDSGGVNAGQTGRLLQSKNKEIDGIGGTHYIEVCVYNTSDNGSTGNDCATKTFTVASDSSATDPVITSVAPSEIRSSLHNQQITISGSNFEQGSIVEWSSLGSNYTPIPSELTITPNSIKFRAILFSTNNVYFRVKTGTKISGVYQVPAIWEAPYRPRLWVLNEGSDQLDDDVRDSHIDSGDTILLKLASLDLDNFTDTYDLHINWGDGQKSIQPSIAQGKATDISHIYTSSASRSNTATIYAQDKNGNKSIPVTFRVLVKGSNSDSKPIQSVAYNSKKEANSEYGGCKVNRSVDTATGSENFTIDLLKTTGLSTLPFSLSYNSSLLSRSNISNGWSHNFKFTSYLEIQQSGDVRLYWDASVKKYNDFSEEIFESKTYRSTDKDVIDDILIRNADDSFTLTRKNRTTYNYDRNGELTSISNYKNNKLELTFEDGRILKVTEPVSGVFLKYLYTYSSDANIYRLSQVEDNSDRTVSLDYDNEGNLSQINAREGTVYTFDYNELGQIEEYKINGVRHFALIYDNKGKVKNEDDGLGDATAIVDYSFDETITVGRILAEYKNKSGDTSKYVYDSNNFNLYTATDPRGFTVDNEFYTTGNNKGKIKKSTDKRGNNTSYEYDSKGNLTNITYDDGSKVQYGYDVNRNKTSIKTISKTGQVLEVINTYDSNNNLKTSKNAQGNTTSFTYNAHNQLETKTSPEGIITKNEYISGRLSKTTYAYSTSDQYSVSFGYDVLGRLTTETDPFGKVTKYTYDSADRLVKVEDPLGNTITHKYDYRSNRVETIDKKGYVTRYTYDNNNNQMTKTDSMGNLYQYEYDSSDRLSKETDPLGNVTTFDYDESGNLIKQTDSTGNSVRFVYDGESNLFKKYDAYGNRIAINDYDVHGNLIKTTDAINRITKKEYDVQGNVVKTTDPLNRVTTLGYDKLGQLTSVINPKNKQITQSFDKDGRLAFFIDSNNSKTEFTYSNAGNILTTKTASGSVATNTYVKNRLKTTKNHRGDTRQYSYDDNSRITSVSDPDGTISYTYDKNDNVLTIKQNGKTITREYDALNRVTRYTGEDGNVIKYDYDAVGNLKKLTYPDNKAVIYSYDTNNRLETVKDWNNKQTKYQYDKNGRLLKTIRPNGTVLTRSYNNAGQLAQQKDVTPTGAIIAQYDYEYDKAGNILTEDTQPAIDPQKMIDLTMSYKAGNQLDKVNAKTPVFDADENMTSLPLSLSNSTMTLAYDSRNRLTSAAGVTSAYDAENHRISTTNAQGKTNYIVNPESPLSQVLVMYQPGPEKTSFIYGNGLQSQIKGSQTLYYHYDIRGSTVAFTNENGDIVDRFSYLPFGGVIEHSVGNTETPFLYNGRDGVMNDGNGLYYMRARFYSPEIRRFVNRDVLLGDVMVTNALNRFAYVNGNPVSLVDPKGKFAFIVGAILGAGAELTTQLISNGGDFSKVDYYSVGKWAAIGAVTGGFSRIARIIPGRVGKIAKYVENKKNIKNINNLKNKIGKKGGTYNIGGKNIQSSGLDKIMQRKLQVANQANKARSLPLLKKALGINFIGIASTLFFSPSVAESPGCELNEY